MGDVKRAYSSAVRDEAARRTREAVVTAAARSFVERGYAATSLADLAASAGVARPTVFAAFGSKANLLRQVVDRALAGDDEPVPVARRPWFRPVLESTTQDGVLAAYADVCTLIGARAAPVFEVVRQAADESEELAQLWATTRANRHAGAAMVVHRLRELGPLRPGLADDVAVDVVWVHNDPGLYGSLVLERGWAVPDFTAWLLGQLRAALLGRGGGG